ncbi:GDP-mannose transporter [Actinomortierella ambigua]|nr:GDP-mannose transporter [Actinomortierella ambigua]
MTAQPSSASGSVASSATLSILAYCTSSILMTVTNKMVLSRFDFDMNFLLLAFQSVMSVLMLWIFKMFDLITYRKLDKNEAKKWFPISLGLVAMIYTGSKSLQYLSIPVYTIFKNLTIILIAYGEVLWFGSKVTPVMLLSFGLMVLSSIIAGWSDLSTPKEGLNELTGYNIGYIWMFLNCLSSAGYVLYMRKRIKYFNFKDFDTVYYNNVLSFPVLLSLSFMMEGWSREELALTFPEQTRQSLFIAILISGISSFTISYGSAWCVRCTSSTTYSMVGALNKLPVAASGILFMGDPASFGNICGIILGFLAGLLYSYSKTTQSKANALDLGTSGTGSGSGASGGGSGGIELSTPSLFKGTSLPLYKPNPDGKSAD